MVRRCVKKTSTQEYAAKIINTKKLSARGEWGGGTCRHLGRWTGVLGAVFRSWELLSKLFQESGIAYWST